MHGFVLENVIIIKYFRSSLKFTNRIQWYQYIYQTIVIANSSINN